MILDSFKNIIFVLRQDFKTLQKCTFQTYVGHLMHKLLVFKFEIKTYDKKPNSYYKMLHYNFIIKVTKMFDE
jgi:hypothetical protein